MTLLPFFFSIKQIWAKIISTTMEYWSNGAFECILIAGSGCLGLHVMATLENIVIAVCEKNEHYGHSFCC